MKLVCFMKEWLMIWNLILPFYENMSVLIWPVWHSHLFWNKFFGVLIQFWTFLFPTIPLFNFHYPTFWILRKNHFVLLQWKLYRYYLSFLHGTIRSGQVVSLFRSGKSMCWLPYFSSIVKNERLLVGV